MYLDAKHHQAQTAKQHIEVHKCCLENRSSSYNDDSTPRTEPDRAAGVAAPLQRRVGEDPMIEHPET